MFYLKTTAKIAPDLQITGISAAQMANIGTFAIDLIRSRALSGIGSDDTPMKPLNQYYAKYKARWGRPVRNLYGPGKGGHMLDNISVRRADANLVRIDITSNIARKKAAANEKKSPWYGWSPRDAATILSAAQDAARGNIREVTGDRGLSIWMDPKRLKSTGYRSAV